MTAVDTPRAKYLALALLAMTQFVVVLDAAIVNVALPSIGRALDFSQDNLAWVVNAYTLPFGGFLLLGGRLADLLGRRKLFMIGLVVFSLASLLGGLAQSEAWLNGGGARASPAGSGRRAGLPRRAVDRDQHLLRGRRAQPRAGRLGRRGRVWRRSWRAARRGVDRVPGLGVGPVRQRADRRHRRAARPAPAGREPRRGRRALLRHRRRRVGHGRSVLARLHARRCQKPRLGIGEDDRPRRRVGP